MTEPLYDIILISGEYCADHPLNAAGLLKRWLEHHDFSVAVIEKPDWSGDRDFLQYGRPRLFFGISSGPIDSLLANYTSLLRPRKEDPHKPVDTGIPDRAVTVYANKIRELHKGVPIVLGGVEASLRRFGHYDFWSNSVRTGILFDTRADILVYGPGEYPLLEIARRFRAQDVPDLTGIASTCIIAHEVPAEFTRLPAVEEIRENPEAFIRMQNLLSNETALVQGFQNRFILQNPMRRLSSAELDAVYDLPFTREIPPQAADLEMARFSVVTHRGCLGGCRFCSLALLQGARIVSRSEESILNEVRHMTGLPGFKGMVADLGGPSANMYGMDCCCAEVPHCLDCPELDRSHGRLIGLLSKVRGIEGVKKVFVRSGIRYDLAPREYIEELSAHHISGTLKIAPEHFSQRVLAYMNKARGCFDDFKDLFEEINADTGQELRYYLMVAHPGAVREDLEIMRRKVSTLKNTESVQIFVPLPMTASACMYYTGKDPATGEEIYVAKTFKEKKQRRRVIIDETKKQYRRR